MTEKELISKLQELRQIKPNQDWVVLTKSRILGEEKKIELTPFLFKSLRFIFQPKLAYAGLAFVFLLVGLVGFSQKALPGDPLYSLKRIIEKSQTFFVSEQEKPQVSLQLADRRLEELSKIVETNQVRKLPQAITEFQASASRVAKNFSKTEEISTNPATIEKIVELAKDKEMVEQILSIQIETEELTNVYKNITENLISDWETRSLTEEQKEVLNRMKELVEQGRYLESLELLPFLINQ